jgi:hypothetical protein
VISSRVKGRASARRTGSPTWTILSRMGETIARGLLCVAGRWGEEGGVLFVGEL